MLVTGGTWRITAEFTALTSPVLVAIVAVMAEWAWPRGRVRSVWCQAHTDGTTSSSLDLIGGWQTSSKVHYCHLSGMGCGTVDRQKGKRISSHNKSSVSVVLILCD